jgi:hypothetical protein
MAEPDAAYHYPPDVFEAVVEAVPLITRSKQDVLTFFRGCGVSQALVSELAPWALSGSDKSKYHITRRVLADVNELGDSGIRVRREVIKRVTEFENFDACWENNRLKAQGAIALLRGLVNRKDTFTRLQNLQEEEQSRHRKAREAELAEQREVREERAAIRADLGNLFSETDPHKRGKALEGVLNRLFKSHGIAIREAFTVTAINEGVVEQIDGAVEIDGRTYLVEMKWWSKAMGRGDVASHLVSVFNRGDVGGIFISNTPYHASVIEDYKDALTKTTVFLVELREIVMLMEREVALLDLLKKKIHAANLSKQPLVFPLD